MGTTLVMPSPESIIMPVVLPLAYNASNGEMKRENVGTLNYSKTIYVKSSLFYFGLRGCSVIKQG